VKKRYEKLVDDLERELKTLRTKVWESDNKCDSFKSEIERLKEKEKIIMNLTKFKKEQLDSYLRLNIHFNDNYKDISQENLENIHKEYIHSFYDKIISIFSQS
jgi:predicted transcriptional regulator